MKSFYVYLHIFPDGKKYVGITSQKPSVRWKNGRGYRRKIKGKWCQPTMAKAVAKYNWDDIKHEILYEGLTEKDARQIESELIALHKTNDPLFGYNIKE